MVYRMSCVCVEVDGGIGVCTPVGYLPPENGLLKWGNIYIYMRVKLNVNMLQYECCIVPLHYSIIDYNWYEYNYVFISLLAAAGINPIYACMTASSLVLDTHVQFFNLCQLYYPKHN